MARRTSSPPTSGMRRSTIATSARRVFSWAMASRPPEHAIDVVTGPPTEPAHEVENPLLVVDDHERWAMPGHAYSLDTARTADRMARS